MGQSKGQGAARRSAAPFTCPSFVLSTSSPRARQIVLSRAKWGNSRGASANGAIGQLDEFELHGSPHLQVCRRFAPSVVLTPIEWVRRHRQNNIASHRGAFPVESDEREFRDRAGRKENNADRNRDEFWNRPRQHYASNFVEFTVQSRRSEFSNGAFRGTVGNFVRFGYADGGRNYYGNHDCYWRRRQHARNRKSISERTDPVSTTNFPWPEFD
jgi:hypothetical protein